MDNRKIDEIEMERWIQALEQEYPYSNINIEKRLMFLLKDMISKEPIKVLEYFKEQKENGFSAPPWLQGLFDELAENLLRADRTGEVDQLFQLGAGWGVPVGVTIHQRLAEIHDKSGNFKKERDALETVLKKEPKNHCVLRSLYELATKEGRFDEAHFLLNRLVEAEGTPAAIAFSFRERRKLPEAEGRPVRIGLLSSYVLDQLVPYLDFECRKANLSPTFYLAPFNQYVQEILNENSSLYQFQPEIVFLAVALGDLFPEVTDFPTYERMEGAALEFVERMVSLSEEFHKRCGALLVVHDFMLPHPSPHGILDNKMKNGLMPWLEKMNCALAEGLRSQERSLVLPLKQVLGGVGHQRAYDPKLQYMASMRISDPGIEELAKYSMRYVKPLKGLTRKCIVLDLDGTLWGGIVGELGVEGIHLGPTAPGVEYLDFQKALLNLTRRGIILAVCSKNNPEDALAAIRNHKYMVLREEHFGAMRINWRNKAENVKEIAEELNIGLDAVVFMDDNPNEREIIRQIFPEVLTVEMPTDPSRFRLTLEAMSDFELLAITREDELRSVQYQAMSKRKAVQKTAASLEEYLHSLEIQAEITTATQGSLPRLVQMFNKTNQFNLTTRRYQSAEMERFVQSSEHRVYLLEVRDRFGDHGMVGAAIVKKEKQSWVIDSFLMSCRVIGLTVETAFLHRIYQDAFEAHVEYLVGEFVPTQKNQPAKDFYRQHGFSLNKESDGLQHWGIKVTGDTIKKPEWIKTRGMVECRDR